MNRSCWFQLRYQRTCCDPYPQLTCLCECHEWASYEDEDGNWRVVRVTRRPVESF